VVPREGSIVLEEVFILGNDELHHLGQGTANSHVHGVMDSLALPDHIGCDNNGKITG